MSPRTGTGIAVSVARLVRFALALALPIALGGCASGGGAKKSAGGSHAGKPRAGRAASAGFDSVTVFLWRFEETAGTRITGEGPNPITGTAGIDTRSELGRVGGSRFFARSIDSFVWSEYQQRMETPAEMTIEAWIRLQSFGQYEDTPIAGRWNPVNADQSWLLTVGGQDLTGASAPLPGPGLNAELLPRSQQSRALARLIFAFQPARAGAPRAFQSNSVLDLARWTHVAATFDGRLVRLYIDGRLDAQYAVAEAIRETAAPLLVGNLFNPRDLTSFQGDLRVRDEADRNPYYAFEGWIDELRLSSVARSEFPYAR